MPNKTKTTGRPTPPKRHRMNPQERSKRMQQILLLAVAILVILSMVLALIAR